MGDNDTINLGSSNCKIFDNSDRDNWLAKAWKGN